MVAPLNSSSNTELWKASSVLEAVMASPKHTAAISTVTSGPAAATLNSTPGESVSFPSFATPPNSHRSIPRIGIPFRIATMA